MYMEEPTEEQRAMAAEETAKVLVNGTNAGSRNIAPLLKMRAEAVENMIVIERDGRFDITMKGPDGDREALQAAITKGKVNAVITKADFEVIDTPATASAKNRLFNLLNQRGG
jgi:hypothetical protein